MGRRDYRDFEPMKLLWTSRSPFVRKVMVAAHEAGVAGRIAIERVLVSFAKTNAEVMAINPLNKIPTLVLDDGTALYDSGVICEYLDSLNEGPKLFPSNPAVRWPALRRQALGDGVMELSILRLGEGMRPDAMRNAAQIDVYRTKIASALDSLEANGPGPGGTVDIGHVTIGTALGYLDFRFASDTWRDGRPKLSGWYAEFARRPSMTATEHADTY